MMIPHSTRVGLYCLLTALSASLAGTAHAQMSTPGVINISSSGAATYTIPIKVPPGRDDLTPQLALTYNSQGGNGLLGIGWSLSGGSVIQACSQNMAQDGAIRGLKFDGTDRLCLDGSRLVLVSGTYGAAGSEYRTEIDRFSKIVYSSGYFTVWTKAGQILTYGTSQSSRIAGNTAPAAWLLDEVADRFSHEMKFGYDNSGVLEGTYLSNINYGTGTGAPVRFIYENRNDTITQYQAGLKRVLKKRLSSIQTYLGTSLIREYRLTYENEPSSARSRLTTISECDPYGSCLPANTITYGSTAEPSFGQTVTSAVLDWGQDAGRAWVDINADGRADYCRVVGAGAASQLACTLAIDGGFGDTLTSSSIDPGLDSGRKWIDVNGDGRPDYCRLTGTTNLVDSKVACTLATATGFGSTIVSGILDWGNADGREWVDADVDGRADFCRVVGTGSSTRFACAVSTGTGFAVDTPSAIKAAGQAKDRAWPDANADGKRDYCRLMGNTNLTDSTLVCSLSAGADADIQSGIVDWGLADGRTWIDINGDGNADYCRVLSSGTSIGCMLSTSAGFVAGSNGQVTDSGVADTRRWIDINGDGKPDFCRVTGAAGTYKLSCTYARDSGFGNTLTSTDTLDIGAAAGREWASVTGDGKMSFCRLVGTTNLQDSRIACTPVVMNFGFATKITSGLGHDTNITYKPLTDPTVYTKDQDAVYPQIDLQLPIHVVTTVVTPSNISGVIAADYNITDTNLTTTYRYGGLKADLKGRGAQGFRWTETTQVDSGFVLRSEYRQDWPYTGLNVLSAKSLAGSGNNGVLTKTERTYACKNPVDGTACTIAVGKRYFPYAAQTTQQGWDLNGAVLPVTTATAQFDQYGNATQTTATTSGYVTTMTNTYNNDTANWLIGQTIRSTTTKTAP